MHFFDRHYDRGLAWYEERFAEAGATEQVGKGTPTYVYSDKVMARVRATLPAARLLVTLRDPVDRAYSHYWHGRVRGKTDLDFAAALDADAQPGGPGHGYLDRGRYLRRLRALEPERAAGRLHVLLFEDLRDAPTPTYAEVCRYLGIDDACVPDIVGRPLNAFTQFRSRRVQRLGRRLPKPARDAIGRVNVKPADYPPLDPALRTRLREHFEADNAELAEWLGRDLAEWRA